jgi:putative RNA 2'-phosphotransferase
MTAIDHERLSRVVSHALRHEPWLYELELDEEGWADIDSVLAALRRWVSFLYRQRQSLAGRRHSIRLH